MLDLDADRPDGARHALLEPPRVHGDAALHPSGDVDGAARRGQRRRGSSPTARSRPRRSTSTSASRSTASTWCRSRRTARRDVGRDGIGENLVLASGQRRPVQELGRAGARARAGRGVRPAAAGDHRSGSRARTRVADVVRRTGMGEWVELQGLDRQRRAGATCGRRARAMAYPTLAEGFGLPVLEAMSIGLPVLASDLPGAARGRWRRRDVVRPARRRLDRCRDDDRSPRSPRSPSGWRARAWRRRRSSAGGGSPRRRSRSSGRPCRALRPVRATQRPKAWRPRVRARAPRATGDGLRQPAGGVQPGRGVHPGGARGPRPAVGARTAPRRSRSRCARPRSGRRRRPWPTTRSPSGGGRRRPRRAAPASASRPAPCRPSARGPAPAAGRRGSRGGAPPRCGRRARASRSSCRAAATPRAPHRPARAGRSRRGAKRRRLTRSTSGSTTRRGLVDHLDARLHDVDAGRGGRDRGAHRGDVRRAQQVVAAEEDHPLAGGELEAPAVVVGDAEVGLVAEVGDRGRRRARRTTPATLSSG